MPRENCSRHYALGLTPSERWQRMYAPRPDGLSRYVTWLDLLIALLFLAGIAAVAVAQS